jgi:thiol-disulfide isomerase/thioredoxin
MMLDRAIRLAPVCLLAALACRPESAVQEPGPEPASEADRGGPTAASTDEANETELDEEVEEEGEPTEPATDVVAEPGADDQPEPVTEEEEQAEPVASAETKTRAPLPKAIHKPGNGKCVQKFAVGEKVKGFKLPSLAGDKTISPSGYKNRVVLLNFWATWCKPCLEELPEFDRLYRKYRSHGLTLVAVTTDEDPKPVQAFVDEHKLSAKVALGGEEAAGQYNRPNFPFSFVVDGDGTIVASFDFVSDACLGDLEQVIRDSLEQLE